MQQISLLEQMSCIECVLTFLGLFDLISFNNCNKKIKKLCEKQICHKRVFDMSSIPNCNLNDVWNIKVTENTIFSNLGLLNNVKAFADLDGYVLPMLPPTVTTLIFNRICDDVCLPPNLQILNFIAKFEIPMGFFPNSLTSLTFEVNDLQPGLLPQSLVYLEITIRDNDTTFVGNIIPENVKTLKLYLWNTCQLLKNSLAENLEFLTLDATPQSWFARDFSFPQKLKIMKITNGFTYVESITLPSRLLSLKLTNGALGVSYIPMKLPPLMTKFSSDRLTHNLTQQLTQLKFLKLTSRKEISNDIIHKFINLHTLFLTSSTIEDFEPLVNVTKLTLNINNKSKQVIKLPRNLKSVRIIGWKYIQDMSYLHQLEKIELEHWVMMKFTKCHLPLHLRSLKIAARSILFDAFPSYLQKLKLDINEIFGKPICFPSTLLKLSLSKTFLQFDLDAMIPPNLQMLCLPKETMRSNDVKFPNVRY